TTFAGEGIEGGRVADAPGTATGVVAAVAGTRVMAARHQHGDVAEQARGHLQDRTDAAAVRAIGVQRAAAIGRARLVARGALCLVAGRRQRARILTGAQDAGLATALTVAAHRVLHAAMARLVTRVVDAVGTRVGDVHLRTVRRHRRVDDDVSARARVV